MQNSEFRMYPPLFYGFFLILIPLIIYYPGLHHGFFCWDDNTVALAPAFQHLTFAGIIQTFHTFHAGLYHPLTSISFMVNYYMGDGSPLPFHLTNLILFLVNTLLLFVFLNRLTGNLRISFLTSLLFTVHPVNVEVVAWITSRKELLFVFFYLLSAIFYTGYSDKRKKVMNYSLVLLFATLALLSKIQAVSLPFIFLLIDYFKGKSLKPQLLLEKIPFFLLCLFFGWLNINAQNSTGLIAYGYHFSFPERAFLLIYSVSMYFLKILSPYPLSVFYPFPFKPGESIPMASLSGPVLLFVGTTIFFIFYRKDKRPVIFGLLFFFLTIIIVSAVSFNRDWIMADRYTYLSSAGILFIIAFFTDDVIRNYQKYRLPVAGLMVAIIMVLSLLTYQRNSMWKDPEGLFRNALAFYPDSEIILNTLASQEIEAGKYQDAIVHLTKALGRSPKYAQAFLNRGLAYEKTGNFRAAVTDFSSSIMINAGYYDALFARGNAYMKMNDLKQSQDDFTKVLSLNPGHFGALQNRAIVRGNLGDFPGALEDLNAAISLHPEFAASYYLRGIALFNTGGNGCPDLTKALLMGYTEATRAIEYYCK